MTLMQGALLELTAERDAAAAEADHLTRQLQSHQAQAQTLVTAVFSPRATTSSSRVRPATNQFSSQDILRKASKGVTPPKYRRTHSQTKSGARATPKASNENEDFETNEEKFDSKLEDNLRSDLKETLYHEAHAGEKSCCVCAICITSRSNKFIGNPNFHGEFYTFENSPGRLGVEYDRDFNFVMRRLHPPKHISRSVRLFVPDTAIFSNGEIRWIVTTSRV